MTWDYSAINHWWIAFGGDDRVWKITVTPEGMFAVHEGIRQYGQYYTLQGAQSGAYSGELLQEASIHE